MGGIDPTEAPFLVKAGMRTDGNARSYMIASIGNGIGSNQKEVIEQSVRPLAIICGAQDVGINNEYIKTGVKYNENLFGILTLDCGHACLWQKPKEFNAYLDKIMEFIAAK